MVGKDPDTGKYWRQEEKGKTEDEMVGWPHRLNGHEFAQVPGDGEGQESLARCSPWGCKQCGTTEQVTLHHWAPRLKASSTAASISIITDGPHLLALNCAQVTKVWSSQLQEFSPRPQRYGGAQGPEFNPRTWERSRYIAKRHWLSQRTSADPGLGRKRATKRPHGEGTAQTRDPPACSPFLWASGTQRLDSCCRLRQNLSLAGALLSQASVWRPASRLRPAPHGYNPTPGPVLLSQHTGKNGASLPPWSILIPASPLDWP